MGLFFLIAGSFFLLWVEPTQENTGNKAVRTRAFEIWMLSYSLSLVHVPFVFCMKVERKNNSVRLTELQDQTTRKYGTLP